MRTNMVQNLAFVKRLLLRLGRVVVAELLRRLLRVCELLRWQVRGGDDAHQREGRQRRSYFACEAWTKGGASRAGSEGLRARQARINRSTPVEAYELRLGERVEVQHEADDGGGSVFIAIELRRIHGEYREVIVVRRVALGRAGAAIAGNAKVGAALHRALGRLGTFQIAGVLRQAGHVRRDVENDPVPETAAGRRVGIVDREREALGAARRCRPGERGRDVAAGAAEALKNLLAGDLAARRDVRAGQGHRLGGGASSAQESGEKRECGNLEHESSLSKSTRTFSPRSARPEARRMLCVQA